MSSLQCQAVVAYTRLSYTFGHETETVIQTHRLRKLHPPEMASTNTRNEDAQLADDERDFKNACVTLTRFASANFTKIIIDALWHATTSTTSSSLLRRHLIDSSSDILKTQEGGKLLWYAVDKGDLEMATILVEAGANVNVRRPNCRDSMSFLHCLLQQIDNNYSSRGYRQLATLMMDKGADVSARDSKGMSVLYYAVWYEAFTLVKELVRRGVAINVYNEDRSTCVMSLALKSRNVEYLLNLLVCTIEDVATRHERAMFVAEFFIDNNADTKQIKRMLDCGLPVDYTSPHGWTLLNRAITWSRVDLIQLLLDYGADVNKETSLGYRPLHLAVSTPDSFVTTLLVKRGANIHANNRDGEYAIHRACESESTKNIQLLLQLGADVNVRNARGQTALSLMNVEFMTMAELMVIKHLALLKSTGCMIHKSDVEIIRSRRHTNAFYENCLEELKTTKEMTISDNLTYFSLLVMSSSELATRNYKFVKNFNARRQRLKDSFPIYSQEMETKLVIAKKKRKLLRTTRMHVSKTFMGVLPSLVIDKIAYCTYIDEWHRLERNHYFQSHEII